MAPGSRRLPPPTRTLISSCICHGEKAKLQPPVFPESLQIMSRVLLGGDRRPHVYLHPNSLGMRRGDDGWGMSIQPREARWAGLGCVEVNRAGPGGRVGCSRESALCRRRALAGCRGYSPFTPRGGGPGWGARSLRGECRSVRTAPGRLTHGLKPGPGQGLKHRGHPIHTVPGSVPSCAACWR